MGKYKLKGRQKMKAINKMAFVIAGASILGLAAYFTVFISTTQVEESTAGLHQNMMLGYDISTGDVIAAYNYEATDILEADTGPDAIAVSASAKVNDGGADNSKGLSPGKENKSLNFTIPAVKEFNLGGIDLALDYRKSEDNCNLFSRGNSFNFGVKDGKLAIMYKLKGESKKTITVSEVTRYEIPEDDEFRTYRFIYDPVKGKSEIFVNGVVIWSNSSEPQTTLAWKDSDPVVIGRELKGNGTDKVFIDNVIIKATRQINKLPITLINFEAKAENQYVMVSWYTSSESEIDSFIVERSLDAKSFLEIARVKAEGGENKLTAYAVLDKQPVQTVAYYRLVPSNKPLKSVTISTIGYKYRGAGSDLKLSDVEQEEVKN
jgi:hypothetical protein